MTGAVRFVPWIIVGLGSACLLAAAIPSSDLPGQMKYSEFGSLPVIDRGRVKPIDTFARIQLMLISNRQEYTDEAGHSGQPASRWLLTLLAEGVARWYNRVPVPDPEVREWFGLKLEQGRRPVFSIGQMRGALLAKKDEIDRIVKLPEGQRTLLEEKILNVLENMGRQKKVIDAITEAQRDLGIPENLKVFRIENDQVLAMLGLKRREGLRYSIAEIADSEGFKQFLRKATQALQRDEKERDLVDVKVMELYRHMQIHSRIVTELGGVLLVPPPKGSDRWLTLGDALQSGDKNPAVESLMQIILAYGVNEPKSFNKAVDAYQQQMAQTMPSQTADARLEEWFNSFAPFYQCMCLYVVVGLLVCLSWVSWPEVMTRSAFLLCIVIAVAHTIALCLRMYIQGRPPVTNLYSSAVFIGWGCVLMCLVIERLYRNGFGSAGAAVLGFSTLIIAHHLGGSGDTLEMMEAVLDTNFWLATHVTTVTLGYAATLVAGLVGLAFVLLGVPTTLLDQKLRKTLGQVMYGIVCFATLLSFVGTVLGGIWADQSWGRFWGWDPKENGAILIVIMNSLILHARWGGMIKDRGMAVLTMVGSMIVMWSWFGTNQLGVGLHAYGFNKTLVLLCDAFWGGLLVMIGVGLVPLKHWRSFSQQPPKPLPRAPKTALPQPGQRGSTGIVPAN